MRKTVHSVSMLCLHSRNVGGLISPQRMEKPSSAWRVKKASWRWHLRWALQLHEFLQIPNGVTRFPTEQVAPDKTGRQEEVPFQSSAVHF